MGLPVSSQQRRHLAAAQQRGPAAAEPPLANARLAAERQELRREVTLALPLRPPEQALQTVALEQAAARPELLELELATRPAASQTRQAKRSCARSSEPRGEEPEP